MCVLCLNLEVVRRARNSTRGAAQPCCFGEKVGRCKEGTELGLLGQVANWCPGRGEALRAQQQWEVDALGLRDWETGGQREPGRYIKFTPSVVFMHRKLK